MTHTIEHSITGQKDSKRVTGLACGQVKQVKRLKSRAVFHNPEHRADAERRPARGAVKKTVGILHQSAIGRTAVRIIKGVVKLVYGCEAGSVFVHAENR